MTCPKCGSENVSVQAVTTVREKPKHGIVWWILIGWWLEPLLWIFLTIPRLLVALFGRNKKNRQRDAHGGHLPKLRPPLEGLKRNNVVQRDGFLVCSVLFLVLGV